MKVSIIKSTIMLLLLSCAVVVAGALMAGCAGSDGAPGAPGANGADLTTGTVEASTFTFDDLRNIALSGKILSASTAGDQPVVTFQVINKNTGEGITGLRTFSLHIAQLQPEASGSNSYWLNYITSRSATGVAFRPATDPVSQFSGSVMTKQGYSVVDNLDGTYVVTFASNIKSGTTATWGTTYYNPVSASYDPTLTHRIVVGVRSVAVPGGYAGPINPVTGAAFAQFTNTNGVNFVYDFVPSTGAVLTTPARDIVTIDRCNQCHYKLQYGSNNTSGHFGSRTDTKTCAICHTPQNVVSGQTATTNADFTPMIHKLHMGEELPLIETFLTGTLNEITYPQDVRNCTMCHQGALADNWKTKPSRKACGSCHNDVNFATGANHPSAQSDDSICAVCHDSVYIESKHLAVAPPDPNNRYAVTRLTGTTTDSNNNTNASWVAAAGVVPTGAVVITYDVKSVTTTSVNGAERPTIKFKLKSQASSTTTVQDVVFSAGTYSTGVVTDELGIANMVGSPSVYFAWAVPQDGITAPADFNATASGYIKNLWNGTARSNIGSSSSPNYVPTGTITGPDGSGYYTAILSYATVTTGAKMFTGGVGYTYSLSIGISGTTPANTVYVSGQPLTQTNLVSNYTFTPAVGGVGQEGGEGGLSVPAPNVWKAGSIAGTASTARRTIVDNAKCNTCHVKLGVKPTYHAGQRNDAPTCSFCHTVNRVNSGWAVNAKEIIHSIHASAKRVNKFSWEATAGAKFWDVTYPGRGMLRNCEMCHVAGMYDFSASAYTANNGELLNNMLYSTAATGLTATAGYSIITGNETVLSTDTVISPFVTPTVNYGSGFSYNVGTGATTAAAATTLVNSPISSACFACHDTAAARSHMKLNGGSIYEARSTALATTETCLICHGPAANTAYGDFVPAIKAVHRWW